MTLRAVVVLLCAGLCCSLHAGSLPTNRIPKLGSAAVLVKDMRSGELLMTKQAEAPMPIASITKLMTAMVVLDARLDMDERITIQEADKDTLRHSQSRLPIGTRLTRGEALLVALMASENRAAKIEQQVTHIAEPVVYISAKNIEEVQITENVPDASVQKRVC
ncbi:MAG: D-alanyl-D-alanine endopeptidase precursor [Planctomycetes bacterium ADurb.Bin401]|nr:MAG: D-alanyl-D-alanine endopeptidase precursor [Planctomycetes bacterium ADurb.Bin401]